MLRRIAVLLAALLLSGLLSSLLPGWTSLTQAAGGYRVGLRTLGVNNDDGIRLDCTVWYPGIRAPHKLDFQPWTLHAARNGKAAEGRFPLLLLSHASSANRFAYHTTAAWLASCGFVVAAPTHPRDCLHDMSQRFSWEQLQNRSRELSATIDILLTDAVLAPSIDPQRIGLAGFGAGGTAALLLGGALPRCTDWPQWCAQAGPEDDYCNPWGRERITALCRSLPLRRSLADPRIRAVAAVAPGFGMLFGPDAFRHFYPPLLLISAEADTTNPPRLHSGALATLLGAKAQHITLADADQGALMAPCPPLLAEELPELCRSVSPATRQSIHQQLQRALADFFLHYLGSGANLPRIPPPPELQPPATAIQGRPFCPKNADAAGPQKDKT